MRATYGALAPLLAVAASCAAPREVRGGMPLAPHEDQGLLVVSAYSDSEPVELVLASAESVFVRKYVLRVPARELTVRILTARPVITSGPGYRSTTAGG